MMGGTTIPSGNEGSIGGFFVIGVNIEVFVFGGEIKGVVEGAIGGFEDQSSGRARPMSFFVVRGGGGGGGVAGVGVGLRGR